MFDLAGTFDLADQTGRERHEISVPGDVHSALVQAGRIADPYVGRNEYEARWVAERDWTLKRDFDLPAGHGCRLLVIDGLDTVADVVLNGERVLVADSAFREHVVDVAELLRAGANRIEITIRSSLREGELRQAALPFRVPYHAGNCPLPNGNMLRKPQCDFGWDWNIALAPLGIHGRIGLVGGDGEIAGVRIRQAHAGGSVMLSVDAEIRGGAPSSWRVELCGVAVDGTGSAITADIRIEDPELWWPNGLGTQTLHDLTITAGAAVHRQRIALRDIRLVSEPDSTGRGFHLSVNGRSVFARGANWIPADALPGRITREKTDDLLRSAADAHMNMIRVWGGGRYEPDAFYETCDRLGLLVWQDFMFACHLYPATDNFLAEVEREVAYQARRIGHRVALWCGDNELLGALGWFEESRADRDRYLVAYDRLNRTVETSLKRVLPDANWWPSSPSPGPLSFGDTWHDDSSGDMHFWSVWHEGRDFEHYRDVRPRFCSEFGFQSYPSRPVIDRFAAENDLNIASPVMESHQKNAGGNARIAETMFRYFRFPTSFDDFVWLSQVQQGFAIKTAVEYWRTLKPHCMGTLYWQLNDTWPVASWSSLDHGGGWKLLHHMARCFFRPVAVFAVPTEGGGFRLCAVNDGPAEVSLALAFEAVSLAGTVRPLGGTDVAVGTDRAVEMVEIVAGSLRADELLAFSWRASDGTDGHSVVSPLRFKALDLVDAGLSLSTTIVDGAIEARISAKALALFVTLEADGPGRFSDNAVAVYPGRDAVIAFRPEAAAPEGVRLSLRDLRSSYARPRDKGVST